MTMHQLNAVTRLRWLGLGAAVFALTGCDPSSVGTTSVNPLDRSVQTSDATLLGAWYGELNGKEAYVHVVDSTDSNSLQTVIIGEKDRAGHSEGWGEAAATPAKIGDDGYLSVKVGMLQGQASVDDLPYLIVRYHSRDRRHVSIYAMDPDRVSDAIRRGLISATSKGSIDAEPRELVKFIETSNSKDLFSIQIGYLERVAEDDMPTPK